MNSQLEAGQQVNKLGKYLYRHIDGAYKIAFSPNTCDVYMFMYYQVPGQEMHEMKFDINLTTYQNKIRINTTEVTSAEKTVGQDIYKPEQVKDLNAETFEMVYSKIVKHIEKEYEEYDFVF